MPLKIYFCDACNESIPLKDLHSNRITFDAGKIFCANCGGRRPRAAPRFAGAFLVGSAGAALLVGLAYVGGRDLQRGRDETAAVARDVSKIESALNDLRADAFTRAECERMLAPLREAAEKTRADFGVVEERLRAAEAATRTAAADAERRAAEEAKRLAERLTELSDGVRRGAATAADLAALSARVDELADFVAKSAARPAPSASESAPATSPADARGPAADPAEEAEFARFAAMLKEPDAARRYEAVNGLANLHAAGVVDALEGALTDVESFVRDAAVRALRRHASLRSVPRIIGALRDGDLFVRTSAKAALKQLTGVEPAFEPDAEAARREKGVREFEAWWAANAEKFLGPK